MVRQGKKIKFMHEVGHGCDQNFICIHEGKHLPKCTDAKTTTNNNITSYNHHISQKSYVFSNSDSS